jgi:hypothetical protein
MIVKKTQYTLLLLRGTEMVLERHMGKEGRYIR